MADNQAEDDDDRSFGDFKFLPFSNQPLQASHDNDDWGDSMNHSNNQLDARFEQSNEFFRSHLPSKPSDRFGIPADSTAKIGFHENELTRVQESEKPKWTKPHGAIPLSIFEKEEEEEPVSGNPKNKRCKCFVNIFLVGITRCMVADEGDSSKTIHRLKTTIGLIWMVKEVTFKD